MTDGPEHSRHGHRQDDSSWDVDESEDAIADVFDRFTLDSRRSRRRRREQDVRAEPERAEREQDAPRHSSRSAREVPPHGDYDSSPSQSGSSLFRDEEPASGAALQEQDAVAASSVRSYAWTGGRTKSTFTFELETLVSTGEAFRPGPMVRHEHQFIAELCQHPRSVAEVGALLGVPVGVAKVLLADMAELGWITVHQTVTDGGSAPHLMLMERVLSGLRRL
jgi:hypothetical protein